LNLKTISIVGKPNVGKSSLFNRILRIRDAIISEQAGTTRDIKKREVEILGEKALLIDTGGFDKTSELFSKVTENAIFSAQNADVILYMVDGRIIPEDDDKKLFLELSKLNKPIALVINKIDNENFENDLWEFDSFGTTAVFPISVSHNRRVNALLNWLQTHIKQEVINVTEETQFDEFDGLLQNIEPETAEQDLIKNQNIKKSEQNEISVAIIGRVNVGKSSLLNALLGEERSVVSDVAGTTIDPIDEVIEYNNRTVKFIDTAGIRRRGKIEGIEKYALNRTEKMLERANIAILVLDSSEPFKELDERIAGITERHYLGVLIVLNKWDISQFKYKEIETLVREKFKFLAFAPIITVSALTKKRVEKIYEFIFKINEQYYRRIPTSKINQVVEDAVIKHHLPYVKGVNLKIYYATQYDVAPPRFALIMNKPKYLHFSYKRYLINKFREAFDFEGVPLIITTRGKGQKSDDSETSENQDN
jgi:GTP-binding protein